MSSKVTTLVVSLLAIAEGHSNDKDVLREANTQEVLDVISPELIDRVAHSLYADDQAYLNAYDHLMADDKRTKMDYISSSRPHLAHSMEEVNKKVPYQSEHYKPVLMHPDSHLQDRGFTHNAESHMAGRQSNQLPDTEKLDEVMRRTEETHAKLSRQREDAEQGRQHSLQEKDLRAKRRAEFEADMAARQKAYEEDMRSRQAKYEAEFDEPLDLKPIKHDEPSNRGPRPRSKKRNKRRKHAMTEEERFLEEMKKEELDKDHIRMEAERRKKEDLQKEVAEKQDEERKQMEEEKKRAEEKRKRRQDNRKRRREEAAKKKEDAQRQNESNRLKKLDEEKQKKQDKKNETDETKKDDLKKIPGEKENGIPSLNLQPRFNRSMMLETDRNRGPSPSELHRRQPRFYIDPRFKKDDIQKDDLSSEENHYGQRYRHRSYPDASHGYRYSPSPSPSRRYHRRSYYPADDYFEKTREMRDLAQDERRVEELAELARPIIHKHSRYDSSSEFSSASIYSEGFSHSSISRTSSSSSGKSSLRSSSSSSESSEGWIPTTSGYQPLKEAETEALQRLRRDGKNMRRQHAHLKEHEQLAHFEQAKRPRKRQTSYESSSSQSVQPIKKPAKTRRHWIQPEHVEKTVQVPVTTQSEPSSDERVLQQVSYQSTSSKYSDSDDQHYVHQYHDEVAAEIAAAHSEEEQYNVKYSQLEKDMKYFAEEAERVKDEAYHEAEVAHEEAFLAEQKAKDAEVQAHDLEMKAEEAEQRVEKLDQQATEARYRYRNIRQELKEVQEISAQHETHLKRAQQRFEEQQSRYSYRPDPRHQQKPLSQAPKRYQIDTTEKIAPPESSPPQLNAQNQERMKLEPRRPQSYQQSRSKVVEPEIVFQPYSKSEHGAAAMPKKVQQSQFEKPKLKIQPADSQKVEEERPIVQQEPEKVLKPATKQTKTPIQRPKHEKPKLKNPDRLSPKTEETALAQTLPSSSKPKKSDQTMITPTEQLSEKKAAPKALPEKLKKKAAQKQQQQPIAAKDSRAESQPYTSETAELSAPKPSPRPPSKQYKTPAKDKKQKKTKGASSGDPQTHTSQKKEFQQQKSTKDVAKPARARTTYPKGYRPPKIEEDPIDMMASGEGTWMYRKVPQRGRGDELWHEEPEPTYDSQARSMDKRYMYYLDHRQPTSNEVAGSALMEKNEKERALTVYKSQKEQEIKNDYDKRIAEMTTDYRTKLRELDESYATKKREIDKDRRDITKSITTARDNVDNPDFGLKGTAGIHIDEHLDRLRLRKGQQDEDEEDEEMEPEEEKKYVVKKPLKKRHEVEEEPLIDDEPLAPITPQLGFGKGEMWGNPRMVEMDVELIPSLGDDNQEADDLEEEEELVLPMEEEEDEDEEEVVLPMQQSPEPFYQMYPSTMMQVYDPRMVMPQTEPVMAVPAMIPMQVPFDFQMRPVGWQLSNQPDNKHKRKPSSEKIDGIDPLADIKRRERDLNAERHAREVELQRDYESRLSEFEIDFKQKQRDLEKEKLDLERRLIAEREKEIAEATQEFNKRRKKATADEEGNEEEDEDDEDLPDSELDDPSTDEEDDYYDYYANSSEDDMMNAEGEDLMADDEQLIDHDEDIYELEWELEPTLKQTKQPTEMASSDPDLAEPVKKKDRKSRKIAREERRQKRRSSRENPKSSRHHRHEEHNERGTRRHKSRRNQDEKTSHRHKHRHSQNGMQKANSSQMDNALSFHYVTGSQQDHQQAPLVSQHYLHDDNYGDFGKTADGQDLNYETFELPVPKIPQMPIARVPTRPPHPLGRKYSHELEPSLEQLLLSAQEKSMYDPYPLDVDHHGVEFHPFHDLALYKHSPAAVVAREPYGPQYHELPIPHKHGHFYPDVVEQLRDSNRRVYDDKKDLEQQLFGPSIKHVYAQGHPEDIDYRELASYLFGDQYGVADLDQGDEVDYYGNGAFANSFDYYDNNYDYYEDDNDFDYYEDEDFDNNFEYYDDFGFDQHGYGGVDYTNYDYGGENDMSMRAFPMIKPIEYDPDEMARRLQKARMLGNTPAKDDEIDPQEELQRQHHRRQTHSFDLRKEKEEIAKIASAEKEQPQSKPKEVKEAKKVRRQKEKKEDQPLTTSGSHPKRQQAKKKKNIEKKPVVAAPQTKPVVQKQMHFEPKEDDLPNLLKEKKPQHQEQPDLTSPQSFNPRKDPMGIDFEKIAMRRAQKQATFRRKEREEEAQWDMVHGGRFSYADEHRSGDKEMLDSKQHAALDDAFHRDEEEYDMQRLMKPSFENFKLQFVSPHDQVEDKISQADIAAGEQTQKVTANAKKSKDQLPHQINFDQIAREREQTHESFASRYFDEEHPQDGQGGRLTYDSKSKREAAAHPHPHSAFHSKHEQRRLEQLGIDFESTFDLKEPPKTKPHGLKSSPAPGAINLQQVGTQKSPTQNQQQSKQIDKKGYQSQRPVTTPAPPPSSTMIPPQKVGDVDRTEQESPLMLDAAQGKKIRAAAKQAEKAADELEKALEAPGVHFWQGQQHSEHKFSLMDPVHPAKHWSQEQEFDEHYLFGDKNKKTKEADLDILPHIDAEQVSQKSPRYSEKLPSYGQKSQPSYMPPMTTQQQHPYSTQPMQAPKVPIAQTPPLYGYAPIQQPYLVQPTPWYPQPSYVIQPQPQRFAQPGQQPQTWTQQNPQPFGTGQQQYTGYQQQYGQKPPQPMMYPQRSVYEPSKQPQPQPQRTVYEPSQQSQPQPGQPQAESSQSEKSVTATMQLPYKPRESSQLQQGQQPMPQVDQPTPQIQQSQIRLPMSSRPQSNPDVTITKTLEPQQRRFSDSQAKRSDGVLLQ